LKWQRVCKDEKKRDGYYGNKPGSPLTVILQGQRTKKERPAEGTSGCSSGDLHYGGTDHKRPPPEKKKRESPTATVLDTQALVKGPEKRDGIQSEKPKDTARQTSWVARKFHECFDRPKKSRKRLPPTVEKKAQRNL